MVIKIIFIIIGTISLGLGIIGMFLPLLPTTPFLLFSAFCFARSSERYYNWLLTNRLFGKYIKNYREGRGISRTHKVVTILLLWLTISYTICFETGLSWVSLILLAIAMGVTIHLIKMKTLIRIPKNDTLAQIESS